MLHPLPEELTEEEFTFLSWLTRLDPHRPVAAPERLIEWGLMDEGETGPQITAKGREWLRLATGN